MHATITPQFALPPACPGLLSPHLLLHWGCPLVLCNPPGPILGLQRGHFASPAHSSGQTSGVCPGPRQGLLPSLGHRPAPPRRRACTYAFSPPYPGAATLLTARLPPPPLPQAGIPLAQGRIAVSLPHAAPSFLPKDPSPWTGLGVAGRTLLSPPPPPPPSSTTSSSCDCRGGLV